MAYLNKTEPRDDVCSWSLCSSTAHQFLIDAFSVKSVSRLLVVCEIYDAQWFELLTVERWQNHINKLEDCWANEATAGSELACPCNVFESTNWLVLIYGCQGPSEKMFDILEVYRSHVCAGTKRVLKENAKAWSMFWLAWIGLIYRAAKNTD